MLTNILKVIWGLCFTVVLVVTLFYYDPNDVNDIGIFFMSCVLYLTFPIGLLISALFVGLTFFLEQLKWSYHVLDNGYIGFTVMWLVFFIAGYLQWFVLLPWLWRKWKSWRSK